MLLYLDQGGLSLTDWYAMLIQLEGCTNLIVLVPYLSRL